MQRDDQKGKTGREIKEKEWRKTVNQISFSCNQNKLQENSGLNKIFNIYFSCSKSVDRGSDFFRAAKQYNSSHVLTRNQGVK